MGVLNPILQKLISAKKLAQFASRTDYVRNYRIKAIERAKQNVVDILMLNPRLSVSAYGLNKALSALKTGDYNNKDIANLMNEFVSDIDKNIATISKSPSPIKKEITQFEQDLFIQLQEIRREIILYVNEGNRYAIGELSSPPKVNAIYQRLMKLQDDTETAPIKNKARKQKIWLGLGQIQLTLLRVEDSVKRKLINQRGGAVGMATLAIRSLDAIFPLLKP